MSEQINYDKEKAHYVSATGIVIMDRKYLIVKRADWEKAFPGKWTVPGGKLEVKDYIFREKDTPHHWYNLFEDLVRREVKEEVNLEIKDIGYVTSMVYIRPDNIPCIIVSLFAYSINNNIKLCEALTDYAWVSLEEAKNYELIEGIYEELEMLDKRLKGNPIEMWGEERKIKQIKIGIDLDEVIVDFMIKFLEYYNKKTEQNILIENIKSYNLWENEVFGGTKEKAIEVVDEFYKSENFDEMKLVEGADRFIKEVSKNYKIFIITSRPQRFREKTENFFQKHFNGIDFDIIYTSDFHDSNGKKKSEVCQELGINFFVDDNKKYTKECADCGIKVFLFDRPWNRDCEEHENIMRINNWNEILQEINKIIKNKGEK